MSTGHACERHRRNRRTAVRLALVTVAMFGFGFALVPIYDVFCEITGLNGKTGRVEAAALDGQVDLGRTVTVEFVSSVVTLNWAVVTSSSRALALKKLAACDFPLPDILVSADDILRGKPDPEPFVTAADKLNVSPNDCIAFEDSESGVISALEAGCAVVVGDYSGKYSADVFGRIHSFRQIRLSENGMIRIENS